MQQYVDNDAFFFDKRLDAIIYIFNKLIVIFIKNEDKWQP